MKEDSSTAYLVICRSGVASLAPFRALAAVIKVPIRLSHDLRDAEHALMTERAIRGVVIDTHFEHWQAAVMLVKRLRPYVFAVLFGEADCSDPTCVNAVLPDRDLLSLLDLLRINERSE